MKKPPADAQKYFLLGMGKVILSDPGQLGQSFEHPLSDRSSVTH
jgi:hypothetical protein